MNNSRIHTIKNVEFSGYYFYMNNRVSIPPISKSSPPFLKSPQPPPLPHLTGKSVIQSFPLSTKMQLELSSINTIYVKQQHNIDFLIFKFSVKCSLTEKTVWEVYFKYTLSMLHLQFLIKEVSNNFFNQWILFSYLGKAKETLKIFHPPHYKTTSPPFLAFPSHF